ncbi:MAG: hypothetical protein PHQ96_08990, partial [Candidatus Omnitrophica bacterium]|nr:hypothetical protein [Candidatus Omnitrophota bacterium]
HWNKQPPFTSIFTRETAVSYINAFRPHAPHKGEEILSDIKSLINDFKPTKIFISHPGDHNPDHCSLYLFTRVALWELENKIHPAIYPYLIHFKNWPLPRGFNPLNSLEPPAFFKNQIRWQRFPLTVAEVTLKNNSLKMHKTQYESAPKYLASFVRTDELFGDFPSFGLSPKNNLVHLFSNFHQAASRDGKSMRDKGFFPGISEEQLRLNNDSLEVYINFSQPLAREARVYLYFFGWRSDIAFKDMPKLYMQLGLLKSAAFDQGHRIPLKDIKIVKESKRIVVTIPLTALGSPTRIFTSATSYLGEVPLDWPSWYIVTILPN